MKNQNSKDSDRFVKDPAEVNLRSVDSLAEKEHAIIIELIDSLSQKTQYERETRLFIKTFHHEYKQYNSCEAIALARSLGFVVIRRRIRRNPEDSYAYYDVSYLGWQYFYKYVKECIYRRLRYR